MNDKISFVIGVALLGTMTGCVGYVDGPRAGGYVSPPVVETQVVVQDDYVYYPTYGIYFNSGRQQYAYLENGAWVLAPAPQGVSVEVLRASPSVDMDWHDSPEKHHAEMLQRYPKDWKSSVEHHDQKDERKAGPPDGDKKH